MRAGVVVAPRSRAGEVRGLCERTGSREVQRCVGDVDGRHVERHTHERVSVRPRVDRVGDTAQGAGDATDHGFTSSVLRANTRTTRVSSRMVTSYASSIHGMLSGSLCFPPPYQYVHPTHVPSGRRVAVALLS